MFSHPKPSRNKSQDALRLCRLQRCIVCTQLGSSQQGATQPAHISSKGSGGGNEASNIMPLCFTHHREQHDFGWVRFVKKYPAVRMYLELMERQDVLSKVDAIP